MGATNSKWRSLALAAGIVAVFLVMWAVLAWPLPRYVARGIPASAHNGEAFAARRMLPGDHLQLLYHFQLMDGMLAGEVPWFHNLYEFNTGDDHATRWPGVFFAPFSLVYALWVPLLGVAGAWNLMLLTTILLHGVLLWLLARRFTPRPEVALLASVAGVSLSFCWVKLLGGSPTGLGLLWFPLLLLGLDLLYRDGRFAGGLLAGIATTGAALGDKHIFFFAALAGPAWLALLSLYLDRRAMERRFWLRRLRAGWPLLAGVCLAAVYAQVSSRRLAATGMAGGRGLGEVALFSPEAHGFFTWGGTDIATQIYLGYPLLLVLLMALAGCVVACVGARQRRMREWLVPLLLLAAILLTCVLALGPHGPWHGRLFLAVRKVIPPYQMIRQSGKIFCVMPVLVAALLAVTQGGLGGFRPRGVVRSVPLLLAVLLTAESARRLDTLVCLLDDEQEAYAAVARDADRLGRERRAIIIPLWPGDAHYASIYEYFCARYRIKMINGYSPAVPAGYVEEVFRPLAGLNQGAVTEAQLHFLLERGIGYLLVHQDQFPEKVSPFPVRFTIDRLDEHARLTFLTREGPVWAFRIEAPGDAAESPDRTPCEILFSTRRWAAGRFAPGPERQGRDETAAGGVYVHVGPDALTLPSVAAPPAPALRYVLRGRGQGEAVAEVLMDGQAVHTVPIVWASASEWTWYAVPVPLTAYGRVALRVHQPQGAGHLDRVWLAAGASHVPAVGETITIPAACFFHAGYSDRETREVVLRREYDPSDRSIYSRRGVRADGPGADPAAAVWYGELRLIPGRYRFVLHGSRPAGEAGRIVLSQAGRAMEEYPVTAASVDWYWTQTDTIPLRVGMVFARQEDVTLYSLSVTREE